MSRGYVVFLAWRWGEQKASRWTRRVIQRLHNPLGRKQIWAWQLRAQDTPRWIKYARLHLVILFTERCWTRNVSMVCHALWHASLGHSFIHSFVRSFVRSVSHSISHSVTQSVSQSVSHSVTQSLSRSLSQSLTLGSLTHSLTNSFSFKFIHSFIGIHSFPCPFTLTPTHSYSPPATTIVATWIRILQIRKILTVLVITLQTTFSSHEGWKGWRHYCDFSKSSMVFPLKGPDIGKHEQLTVYQRHAAENDDER